MNAKPKTELNISVFMQKRNSVTGPYKVAQKSYSVQRVAFGRIFRIFPPRLHSHTSEKSQRVAMNLRK